MQSIKCVLVGDIGVGKTSLAATYCKSEKLDAGERSQGGDEEITKTFTTTTSIFENYLKKVELEGLTVCLGIWDINSDKEYKQFRLNKYIESDCILICYAADNIASFKNINELWYPEIGEILRKEKQNTPIIIVETKTDIRNKNIELENIVEESDIEELIKSISHVEFCRCSIESMESVNECFEKVIQHILSNPE